MAFTEEQMQRYSRHLILKGVGVKGQQKLLESKVLVIGAGGLGSPAILYLAASGVGTIGIVDGDCVDLTNLQRQIIHDMDSLGVEKTESAGERIRKLNPDVKLHLHAERVTPENIMALIEPYDFIIDAVDNFSAKFLINDACVLAKKPFCHAGIRQFYGQVLTYVPGRDRAIGVFSKKFQKMEQWTIVLPQGLLVRFLELLEVFRPWKRKNILPGRRTSYRENAYLRWTDDEISDGEFWKSVKRMPCMRRTCRYS